MHRSFISKASLIVREEIGKEIIYYHFPPSFAGSCGVSSTILAKALKYFGINVRPVIGFYCQVNNLNEQYYANHAFNLVDDRYILDITASQFGDEPLVITSLNDKRYKIRLKGDRSVRYDLQCWIPKQRPQFHNVKQIVNNSISRIYNELGIKRNRYSK